MFNFVSRKSSDFSSANHLSSLISPTAATASPPTTDLQSLQIYHSDGAPVRVQVRNSPSRTASPAATAVPASPAGPTADAAAAAASPNGGVVMRRQTGLGRRAVTQIQIQQKKNSYVSAVCKSQENLAQVGRNYYSHKDNPFCVHVKKKNVKKSPHY